MDKIFNFSWIVQRKIIKAVSNREINPKCISICLWCKWLSIGLLILLVWLSLYLNFTNSYFFKIGAILLGFIIVLCNYYPKMEQPLISARKFLTTGFAYVFLMGLIILLTILSFVNFSSFSNSDFMVYIFGTIVYLVLWVFLSLIANNKTSTVVNTLVTTILSVSTIIINTIFDFLPDNTVFVKGYPYLDILSGYTQKQVFKALFDLFILPLLLINAVSTLFCLTKWYWIEKYNNKQDICMELLDKEISEIQLTS